MFTDKQLREIFDKTGGHCHFCGDRLYFKRYGWKKETPLKGAWEADHVIQRAKGGAKGIENCLPACVRCNRLRWHRRGREMRELLTLGLVAKDGIKKGTDFGKEASRLMKKREEAKVKRRRNS